jgi:hypothetical protein
METNLLGRGPLKSARILFSDRTTLFEHRVQKKPTGAGLWRRISVLERAFTRLYYHVKPAIPRSVRYSLRRVSAQRRLASNHDVWPIRRTAAITPPNWPGWPDGKQFAVVLSHDVESEIGLRRSLQLARLEKELGFRSLFNFIPEGEYRVSPELRAQLTKEGFEVGVHDLKHDGKLFRSRRGFQEHAQRINEYLAEWGSVGFRSGFMLNELDWIHDLEIQYDSSTFDTDPFEPQPEGANTIFPFWVPRPQSFQPHGGAPESDPGYVELPYTLPQDSTLYIIFRHTTDAIWREKLSWIAENGGMVLMNTHPDYMNFAGKPRGGEFDVRIYADFLKHLRSQYEGTYWHALPRDVAGWIRSSRRGQKETI